MSNRVPIAKLAVVVTTYNQARYLRDALEGVRTQVPAPAELVVVDDGSQDDPQAALHDLPYPVRFFRQANAGVSAARNRGLLMTSSPRVAFLDADDAWPAGFVAAGIRALDDCPEAAAVVMGYRPLLEGGATLSDYLPAVDPEPRRLGFRDFYWRNPVISPSLAVFQREALTAVGGFDAELPLVGDYDLWLRLTLRSPVVRLAEPRVCYRIHATNASRLDWAAMVEQEALLFARLEEQALPVSRRERRERMARIHHALAYNRLAAGMPGAARRAVWTALAGQPFRVKNWLFLGASLLPGPFVQKRMRARVPQAALPTRST